MADNTKIQPPAGRENKPHIGIFGRCNAGKSTLLNFIVGAPAAIVSPECGTTTDVVRKSYEIEGFAPAVFIDTAGIDDTSSLAAARLERTFETIYQIDLALIVYTRWGEPETALAGRLAEAAVPFVVVNNIFDDADYELPPGIDPERVVAVDASSDCPNQRDQLLEAIKRTIPESSLRTPSMFEGVAGSGDTVLLICPIDRGAPAGRLILPQVQAVRELLDRGAVAVVVQPSEIGRALDAGIRPKVAVTDSQVFAEVRAALPQEIPLTSFSILLAAAKGDMEMYRRGLDAVDALRDGDRVLIAESCSHQVSCEDIGRVKIPTWLKEHTGKELQFTTITGLSPLPPNLEGYALMVQCGGCMVTRSQLRNRIRLAAAAGVPVTNYGMLIRKLRAGGK